MTTRCLSLLWTTALIMSASGSKPPVHGGNAHALEYAPDATGCHQHRLWALRARPGQGAELHNRFALVLVNYKLDKPLLERLWANATTRICADGAINRLYRLFDTEEDRARFIPEYIRGDLDSVEEDVRTYYTSRGSELSLDADQDTTDLQKCLHLLQTLDLGVDQVIVLGAFGGRIDHEFSHYAILYKYPQANIVLLSRKRAAFLLKPGAHHLHDEHMGPMCGLVPAGSGVRSVETSGLEWNIQGKEMSLAGLCSTSNKFVESPVSVKTSDPILWVSEVHSDIPDKPK